MIIDCNKDGLPGFKWGESGRVFTYVAGNTVSREAAREACLKYGRTVQVQYFAMPVQNVSNADIRGMLDDGAMAKIKVEDPSPLIRVFGIGHEGDAAGSMIGDGPRVFRYLQHAIERMHAKVKSGVSVFNRHAAGTNDHGGREKIGEVVGKSLKTIGGRLYSLAAIYLYPQYKDSNLDVASIEANVAFTRDANGAAMVQDVDEVTGIALSSHDVDSPGFPGATLLGAIQAFANNSKEGNGVMTLEELQKAIREGNYKASDLFAKEVLTADPVVTAHVKAEKQTEYEHAKRVENKLGEEREARMKDSKTYADEIAKLKSVAIKATTGGVLATLATERKLDDRQKKFVESNLAGFTTEAADDDGVRKELNTWIDKQLDQYNQYAGIFGVKTEKAGEGDGGGDKGAGGAGAPSGDGNNAGGGPKDLTDPKNNPMIPA